MADKTSDEAEQSAMDRLTRLGLMTEASRRLVETMLAARDDELEQLRSAKRHLSERISTGQEGWNELHREVERLRAERDALKAELAEMKRVTEPPTAEEMPTDPAELREMWEFINRQTRWQYHMAHKFGGQVGLLRAELAEARAAIERRNPAGHLVEWYRLSWESARRRARRQRGRAETVEARLIELGDEAWLERLENDEVMADLADRGALDASQRPEDTREETGRG